MGIVVMKGFIVGDELMIGVQLSDYLVPSTKNSVFLSRQDFDFD